MFIINEEASTTSIPFNIKSTKEKIRFECILQTVGDINRNRRRYSRGLVEEGIVKINERIKEGSFLGELDHPISSEPQRQVTVLFANASHRIIDIGWDGNKLVGTLESLRTPMGTILKNLAEDGIPIGFSFRGMGDLKEVNENGVVIHDVQPPLHVVTWDAVGHPSHKEAKIVKINEATISAIYKKVTIHESSGVNESNGMICTSEGVCYLPDQFDKLVDQRKIRLIDKYKIN